MENRKLLTISEVAHLLRVDDTTVRRWIRQSLLKAVTLPGRARKTYRIREETLQNLLIEE
jgi:excisionase family DNA binding protein